MSGFRKVGVYRKSRNAISYELRAAEKDNVPIKVEIDMDFEPSGFRRQVGSLAEQWQQSGLPSRAVLEEKGRELASQRTLSGGRGLWDVQPLMVTATLDDGLGQGLMIIHQFAEAVGIRILSLGLMQSPERIISVCQKEEPDFLGLTILQFDTEEELTAIARAVPRRTRLICGGPVFNADSDLAERSGVHFVARHVGVFLKIVLTLSENQ